MTDYRDIWNSGYAAFQQGKQEPPDLQELKRFAQVYAYYLRNWLPRDKSRPVVDLGCGSGLLVNFLIQQGYQDVLGIDSSDSQINLARQLGLPCKKDDALPFLQNNPDRFQLITATDLIEHFDKNESLRFLDLAFASLKPGGRIILQTPNGESPWVGNVLYGDLTHEQCFTPDLLRKLMQRTGFTHIDLRGCGPAPIDFQSILRYCIWAGITQACRVINLIEGAVSCGVYSRVFLISGIRA